MCCDRGGLQRRPLRWYGLTCFTVLVVSKSFLFTWMRLKRGSLWTGVLLHASHNLFVQGVRPPLTARTANTKYFVDDFAAVLPVLTVLLALLFWRLRGQLLEPAEADL